MAARDLPECPLCGMEFGEEEDHHAPGADRESSRRLRGLEERLHGLEKGGSGTHGSGRTCPSCRSSVPAAARGADREQIAREVRAEIERLRGRGSAG